MSELHHIAGRTLSATIAAEGAELRSLRSGAGDELLWQAEPPWPEHAPILFPIVGRLKDDRLRLGDTQFAMPLHGFARHGRFAWVERGPRHCRLRLEDDAGTRARYPFAFRLEVAYAVDGDRLEVTYAIANPGPDMLPASAGAHPGFKWPLSPGVAKDAHRLDFARPEPGPLRRLGADGLVDPTPLPSPIGGRTLALDEELFRVSALIFDSPASSSVRFHGPGTPAIELSWAGFTQLGIWSKPGAGFLCIEPWHGRTSDSGWDGDFRDKPGVMLIPPGGRRELSWSVRITD